MAQEQMDDFVQMARYYAEAEKQLKVQHWVFISFERKDDNGNTVRIFSYDLPREVYERRRWVIDWRNARLVCKYPKGNVRTCFSYYDKRLGNDYKLNDDLRKLISAKAQVTKVQRRIAEYIEHNKANNLFFDESSDIDLIKVREKLAIKELNVQEAEERLKLKIRQIKEVAK